jgi:hypothetical protein
VDEPVPGIDVPPKPYAHPLTLEELADVFDTILVGFSADTTGTAAGARRFASVIVDVASSALGESDWIDATSFSRRS